MSNVKLTETVTVEREIKGVIRDLVLFARYLEEESHGLVKITMTNADLVRAANDYWDREHGE